MDENIAQSTIIKSVTSVRVVCTAPQADLIRKVLAEKYGDRLLAASAKDHIQDLVIVTFVIDEPVGPRDQNFRAHLHGIIEGTRIASVVGG